MNIRRILTLGLALLLTAARGADPAPPELDAAFREARTAYDAGDFAGAAARYQRLLESGWAAPALFFNWGNACYRQDRLGEAIQHYRRAHMLAPGDADTAANLQMAAQRTGAVLPEPWLLAELLRKLPRDAWTGVAVAAWWITLLLLAAGRLFNGLRLPAAPVLVVGALVLLLAGAGRWCAHDITRTAEAALLGAAELKSAPASDATSLVRLPEGSIVEIVEDGGTWMRVASGKDRGWVPAPRLGRVRL